MNIILTLNLLTLNLFIGIGIYKKVLEVLFRENKESAKTHFNVSTKGTDYLYEPFFNSGNYQKNKNFFFFFFFVIIIFVNSNINFIIFCYYYIYIFAYIWIYLLSPLFSFSSIEIFLIFLPPLFLPAILNIEEGNFQESYKNCKKSLDIYPDFNRAQNLLKMIQNHFSII